MPSCRDAALAYLARGWSAIALRPREKRPLIPWQTYQKKLPSAADVTTWFDRWPDANVGIVTGAVSGIVVVDVDPRHGGVQSLAMLEAEHAPLPRTIEAQSGGGGRHLYFLHPGGVVHNRVAFVAGVDIRGDGGLIVAPPSVHPNGNRYRWTHAPERAELTPLPPWLLVLAAPGHAARGHSAAYWRELLAAGVAEGARNDSIASLTGHLLARDVDPPVVTELVLCWNRVRCRPPLSDAEVVRTVASIERLHRRGAQHSEDGGES